MIIKIFKMGFPGRSDADAPAMGRPEELLGQEDPLKEGIAALQYSYLGIPAAEE